MIQYYTIKSVNLKIKKTPTKTKSTNFLLLQVGEKIGGAKTTYKWTS